MVSYYASEQERLRAYRKDRKLKEELEEDQQERLDELLDKQNGLDDTDKLWKTVMPNAIKRLGKSKVMEPAGDVLLNAINNGKLDELIKMVRSVDETDFKNAGVEGGFNRNMKSMVNRLKDEQERAVLNMLIGEQMENGPEAIKEAIVNYMTDGKPELRTNFYKMLNMVSNNFNIEDFDKVGDISKNREKRNEKKEISLMEEEDKRSRLLEELEKLGAEEDLKLREQFLEVLNEMKSSNSVKNEVRLINSIIKLVEKQRLEDAFKKWSDFAMEDAFASKIQRNMKALMENKKIRQQAKEKMNIREMEKRDVNMIPAEELEKPRVKKRGRKLIPINKEVERYKGLLKELENNVKGHRRKAVRDDMKNIENKLKDSGDYYRIVALFDKKQQLMNN